MVLLLWKIPFVWWDRCDIGAGNFLFDRSFTRIGKNRAMAKFEIRLDITGIMLALIPLY